MQIKNLITTVNYHLWKACNMRFKFCYATFQDYPKDFLPKEHLPLDESKLIIDQIAAHGFKKINFAGGEPTLSSWLPELVIYAKSLNLETSIVSNGWTIPPSHSPRLVTLQLFYHYVHHHILGM